MTQHIIRGIRFKIDDRGFVNSPFGEIGHTETCEEIAGFLQSLFEIIEAID